MTTPAPVITRLHKLCDWPGCNRQAIRRVMVSRSPHESARHASGCKYHAWRMEMK